MKTVSLLLGNFTPSKFYSFSLKYHRRFTQKRLFEGQIQIFMYYLEAGEYVVCRRGTLTLNISVVFSSSVKNTVVLQEFRLTHQHLV